MASLESVAGRPDQGAASPCPLSEDALRLADFPALRSHKDAAGGVALEGGFERVLAQLLDRPLLPRDDGSKQPSSSMGMLSDRIRYMSKFVPEFVSQRLAATKDADMVAEHRHVSILFVIGSFQVRDARQGMAAPEFTAWAVYGVRAPGSGPASDGSEGWLMRCSPRNDCVPPGCHAGGVGCLQRDDVKLGDRPSAAVGHGNGRGCGCVWGHSPPGKIAWWWASLSLYCLALHRVVGSVVPPSGHVHRVP